MKNCSSEELAPLVAHLNPLAIPMGVLGPDDWLTHHPELGQVLAEFLRASCPLKAFGKTNVIYVYTTEELSPNFPTTLQKFLRFIESYFQLEVRRGREIRLSEFRADEQRGQRLRTEGFARILKEGKCHCGDGFGHVVLTTKDLFSIDEKGKHWPWVYGDSWFGSVSGGEAVISTNRYSEKAGDLANDTSIGLPELRRLLKVILHEIGHLFFILHEIRYRCLMSGINHLGELDRNPIEMCSVNLAKIIHATGLHPQRRAEELIKLCSEFGLSEEAALYQKQLSLLKTLPTDEHVSA